MKIAIVGSRSLVADIPAELVGTGVDEIVSGGAVGIDRAARCYAKKHRIRIEEIIPEYDLYGHIAPLKRNDYIIDRCDRVLIFWDGKSRGSDYVVKRCRRLNKPMKLFLWEKGSFELIEEITESSLLQPTFLKTLFC